MSVQKKIDQQALDAQKLARKFFVIELDFSQSGLRELDEAAGGVDVYMRGGASEENIELLTLAWGGYLGETIRRGGAGEWVAADNAFGAALRIGSETYSPHEQVRKRMLEGEDHDLAAYAEQLMQLGQL